jgi:16S rRNA (uracil1498-N3)-methyltransferase
MKLPRCSSQHEFALYSPLADQCGRFSLGDEIVIDDDMLCTRIRKVLRLREHEIVSFFGASYCVTGEIVAITSERCTIRMQVCRALSPLVPEIFLGVSLLERAAFEEVAMWATVLGVTRIIPYVATKSKRHECATAERERLRRVMIAAAEQSKQYVLPVIESVIPLAQLLLQDGVCIVFDMNGSPAAQVMQEVEISRAQRMMILCGPEGDWTENERDMLQASGAHLCRLTPTVLRAEHAVAVGVGMIRSVLHRT